MKAYRISIGLLVFFTLLIVSPAGDVLGQRAGRYDGKGFLSSLTDEQRQAVQQKTEEMRSQGATRGEIRTAVREMLEGYGVELPEHWGKGEQVRHKRFLTNLNDEQREAIRGKIEEMKTQGASHEEIRAAVAKTLKGYGIELPEKIDGRHGYKGFGHSGFLNKLTDKQRQAVREKIKEMGSQGAARKEIRAVVGEMLEGYGIDLSEKRGERHRDGFRCFLSNLTDEQRKAVREKIKEMRSQGATREEIRTEVTEMLKGYGIELPDKPESISSEKASAKPGLTAQTYPNPFNPQTQIAYNLPEDSYVKLTIYNIQGQKVKLLVDEYQSAGTRNVIWDGCDETGEKVASGVYFYRIEAGPYSVANRMILLK